MLKRYLFMAAVFIVMALLLGGCGASRGETAQADALRIAGNALSAEPSFIDWTQNGTKMQLIACLDGEGQPRVSYNTCQVCQGSPLAYFEYQQGNLVCQNCGNAFSLDALGDEAGGCNPMPVEDYTVEGNDIVIPETELVRAAAAFANWKRA